MKKSQFVVLMLLMAAVPVFFDSCKKDIVGPSTPQTTATSKAARAAESSCKLAWVELMADKDIKIGSVIVTNDKNSLFVTYTAEGNWYIEEMHLYVGDLRLLPRTNSGNPIPGHFPYSMTPESKIQVYTFEVPMSTVDTCFKVAAHASVSQIGNNGEVIKSASAWGKGELINTRGNWGMYFNACKPDPYFVCENPIPLD